VLQLHLYQQTLIACPTSWQKTGGTSSASTENVLVLAKLLNRMLVVHPLTRHDIGSSLKASCYLGYMASYPSEALKSVIVGASLQQGMTIYSIALLPLWQEEELRLVVC